MGYVSNTADDRAEMLAAIGVREIDDLLSQIPQPVRFHGRLDLPPAMDEVSVVRRLRTLASRNVDLEDHISFLGAGIYDHFRPAVVSALASRGEFATSYTPYQPELSQGFLQAMYEYQTLICALTGMDLANASMYDAGTALAEAALMATAVTNRKEVVSLGTVHPHYREVLATYLRWSGFRLTTAPYDDPEAVRNLVSSDTACVVVQHPNFFGYLEDTRGAIEHAHRSGALAVIVCDPISLGLLAPPAEMGADVVVGEGQSLGNPMGFGGPLLGFFACRQRFARSFPGRIVGATVDSHGRRAYTMTLRTREQDIRREKATSNICTNEALLALAATVYLCEIGRAGLQEIAELCLQKAHYAQRVLTDIPGVQAAFSEERFFKEFVVRLPVLPESVNDELLKARVVGGLALGRYYPGMENAMLLCVTENRSRGDIDHLASAVRHSISRAAGAA